MKKFKTLAGTILVASMVLTSLAGCSINTTSDKTESNTESTTESTTENTTEGQDTATPSEENTDLKVALLIPGNLGDKSFFDGSKAALDKIKEKFGAETNIVEMGTDVTKYYATYQDFCEEGYDIILTISTTGDDVLKQVAEEYPDQKFINLDTDTEGFSENVLPVVTKSNEMSALAGVVAAIKAQELNSNEIGFIGGMDIPGINYFLVGYIEGAQLINKDIKVNASYVGSFTDSAKAKELATIMYDSGVPIIYQAAGGSGLGVFEAALAKDTLAIGVDSDQALSLEESSPEQADHIITSAEKKVSDYAVDLIQQYIDETLVFGQKISLGLKDGAVGIAENKYYDALMTDEQKNEVTDAEQKIISGEVELTDTQALSTEEIDSIRSAVAPN